MPSLRRRAKVLERLATLKHTDRSILSYLEGLRQLSEDNTCTVSIPAIATACHISPRQVQISTRRLIKAGFLKRIGYDFGNVVRSRRGTRYKLLQTDYSLDNNPESEKIERAIQVLMEGQSKIESRLERLGLQQDRLLSLVTLLMKNASENAQDEG
jgi:DNA-binding Lrp family transcriptional regulator